LKDGSNDAGKEQRRSGVGGDEPMRIFFEAKNPSYFPLWKVTLIPGENIISDKIGEDLLKAHELSCKSSGESPCIRKLEEPKPKPKPKLAPSPIAMASEKKKGVK
jgi:hypothetical protein